MSDRRRVSEVLAQARELPREERPAFLDAADLSDETRAEVESLLEAADTMGGFLDRPATAALDRPRAYEPGDRVAGYVVEKRLGQGGSGVVYVAMQDQPHRRVALKVMRGGVYTESTLARFRAEAEILGRLRHPHVAHVYEAGVHDGRPFLALEYVEGARTLLEYAAEKQLDRRARLELFTGLCDAVHHGHQKGIVHRDVKPGNVLVEPGGRPKLIDFGIARAGDGPTGELVGTPPYMSPEQCEPDSDVDSRADVYALGVLCQELLTGRAPHRVTGVSAVEAMRRVREDSPVAAASLDRSLRGDIDAILTKATHRDREGRYASASALAADVRRHLRAFPVDARDGGLIYQLACFARRQRGVFAAACLLVVVLGVAAVVNRSLAIDREAERKEAEWQGALANLAAAAAALRVHDVSEAKQRLAAVPDHLRNWEWDHLSARTDHSVEQIVTPQHRQRHGVVSKNGRYIASIIQGLRGRNEEHASVQLIDRRQKTTRILLVGTNADRRDCLAFHPSEPWIAVGHGSGAVRWHTLQDGELVREFVAHESVVIDIAFAPDGTLITASRDKCAKIWNADGTLRHTLRGFADRVICVGVGRNGDRVATGDRAGVIRVWNLESGALLQTLRGHERSVEGVAFSPDDQRLASVSRDQSVRLWNVPSETCLAVRRAHQGNVRDVAFLPQDVFVTASWDGTVRAWDGQQARSLGTLSGHERQVVSVGVSVPERRIVSFSRDGSIRFWIWDDFESVPTLRGHNDQVTRLTFRPDGRRLASAAFDGTVRIWDPATGKLTRAIQAPAKIQYLDWRADGSIVAISGSHWKRWEDESTAVAQEQLIPAIGYPGAAHHDVDADVLYLGNYQCITRIGPGHKRLPPIHVGNGGIVEMSVSKKLSRIVCADTTGQIHMLNAATGERVASRDFGRLVYSVFFAGPECFVAAGAELHSVDVNTLQTRRVFRGHTGLIYAVAMSPDGTRLASGGTDRALRLWDLRAGVQVAVLRGHRFAIRDIRFSRDGAYLASGDGSSEDALSSIKIWRRHRVPRGR